MSTITKEQIEMYASAADATQTFEMDKGKLICVEPEHMLELARIALASLEAEPVYQVLTGDAWVDLSKGAMESQKRVGVIARTLYTAPPAPVSVPDENGLFPCPFCGGRPEEDAGGCSEYDGHEHQDYSINCKSCGAEVYCAVGSFEKADIPCSCHHNAREVCVEKWNRRAAMLQGAEPVSQPCTLPNGYCVMPLNLTAENGAKGALSGEFHVTNRIVCQSCAGEGCEDCNGEGGWDAEIPVSWDTIKRIHEAAVEACSLPAAPQQEVK